MMNNLFNAIPHDLSKEVTEALVSDKNITIERIVSKGHASPDSGWYDQDKHEWVILLQGQGEIVFEEGKRISLMPGDYLTIPAHTKHKVSWTDPNKETIWLAVHY